MASITELFPDLREYGEEDFRRLAVSAKTLLVAITPRTGSTWLCSEFVSRCDVGEVDEILNPRGPIQHAKEWRKRMRFADYWRGRTARAGPIFAFKTGWTDFAFFSPHARTMFPELSVVHIDRRSLEAQALSFYSALETGVWHARDDHEAPRADGQNLNLRKIDRIIDQLLVEKAAWEAFFASTGIGPVRMFYEDFEDDPGRGIAVLAEAAGVAMSPARHSSGGYRKLSQHYPASWLEQIRERQRLKPHGEIG